MAKQPDRDWRRHVVEQMLPRLDANTGPAATSFEPAPLATTVAPTPLAGDFHVQPAFDPVELLPPAAADKLRALRQRSADLHAVIPEGETVRQASAAKIEAANTLKRLTDHPQNGGFNLPETDRRVIVAQQALTKATDDLRRLKELQEVRTAAWREASQAKTACEDWLKTGRPANTTLEAVEIEPPRLLKNESFIDAVERLRRRARELRADLHRIESAPFPSSYGKAQMRAQIEALAMQGAPSVSALIELDGKIEFQTQRVQSEVHAERRSLAFTETADAVALVAWLHKDALIAALDREIASESDDKSALSHEARQKAEAEVMGDLLAVEFQESFFVWQAQSEGLPCEHRADCSPCSILGLKLITTARATELPATSPGFSWPWRR